MTIQELIGSPVVAAIPPALAGAWLAYLRYKLASKRLELGRCPKCDPPEKSELPSLAPMLLLLLSVGIGMLMWSPVGLHINGALAMRGGPTDRCVPRCPVDQRCEGKVCTKLAAPMQPLIETQTAQSAPKRAPSPPASPVGPQSVLPAELASQRWTDGTNPFECGYGQ